MSAVHHTPFTRQTLLADAFVSGATGLLMFGGASILSGLLILPQPLLRYAGLALLPFAAFVFYVATRERPRRGAVWTVIVSNALWALGSIGLLLGGWITPNLLGYGFVLLQAVVVAVFGELQFLALRRSALQTV